MGYIITEGQDPNTYKGYRCATSDMEVNEGEQFVESLEDWSPFIPPPTPKSPLQKLQELTALIASLDYETQADLSVYTPPIATVLSAGQVEVAKILVGRISTNSNPQLEALKNAVIAILES